VQEDWTVRDRGRHHQGEVRGLGSDRGRNTRILFVGVQMSKKKMTVVKLKALRDETERTRMKLSSLIQKLRVYCHHPKSTRRQHTEVVQFGMGMYESEVTHETCGICGHYIGDIP
jgi:hypothetical protein